MPGPSSPVTVHVGFIPLTDAAPIVIAKELGFDREHGLSLELHRGGLLGKHSR